MSELKTDTIKRILGLSRADASITEEIEQSIRAARSGTIFGQRGLCSGFPLMPRPNEYFIAQEFSQSGSDLRQAITLALDGFGLRSVRADDFYSSGAMLCKISSLIQTTPFGVYQLSRSQNRNVYIELGIAIGLGKPFILVKDPGAEVPSLLQALEYVAINSYLELSEELQKKVEATSTLVSRYELPKATDAGSEPRTAFLAQGGYESVDLCIALSRGVHELGFLPVLLTDRDQKVRKYLKAQGISYRMTGDRGMNLLNSVIESICSATFGLYQADRSSQPDAFLALGMALGLNKPFILVQKAYDELPSDLKGISAIPFESYQELSLRLKDELPIRLDAYGLSF